eukprot:363211-Chlamydomonas_euryale.AAC.8
MLCTACVQMPYQAGACAEGTDRQARVPVTLSLVPDAERSETAESQSQEQRSKSQSNKERTHKPEACVEQSKTEGMKKRAGRRHQGYATVRGPEPPHTNATLRTRAREPGTQLQQGHRGAEIQSRHELYTSRTT